MTRLLDLFRLIPGAGRVIGLLLIIGLAVGAVYYQWGLVPALVLAGGILLVVILIFGYNKMIKASEKQNGAAFDRAMSNAQVGASKGEIRSAVGALGQKWREATQNLKASNLDLYTLPWYLLIGEPQSGKSTTLKFSGLRFPVGTESISGGGGTRNCDWWFTEQGIILDTAGRFTFQEETATDSAEWNHFLGLLAKYRPYCPINGVILVIPITSLLGDDSATRQAKARNISEKIFHIQKALAIQFPIFVLLTKGDIIYGFTEFFNKLNVDQQREMFGWSSSVLETGFSLETFDESFGQMAKRISQIRLRNLSRPHYSDDAEKTYIFPEEFSALHKPLREYMSIIFESSVFRAPLFFRGYYLTSGMQEGKPIASACRALIQKGIALPNLEQIFTKSRAFFIRDFYTEKVFPEEGLVQRAFHHLRADKIKKRIIYGLNAALVVLGIFFVWFMYHDLNSRLAVPKKAIDQTLASFETRTGTFFTSDEDREQVYRNLRGLRNAIETGQQGSFWIFFKGKQNQLTESLQDTFAYLFLDRFLVGLYDCVVEQLKEFKLQAPPQPRSSEKELDLLLAALKELNEWRFQVKNGTAEDFKPALTPFLDLAMDPEWNQELSSFRSDLTLKVEFETWFQSVYERSSDRVKAFVIRAMVQRSETLFQDLHLAVLDFYKNQPEMKRYLHKRDILRDLESAYARVKEPSPDPELYHERLMALPAFFSQETQDILAPGGDIYLNISTIIDTTLKALGPAFESMKDPEGRVTRDARNRRDLLPDVVTFVNNLLAIDPRDVPDPRAEDRGPVQEGEEVVDKSLTYSPETKSFWDLIVQPYVTDIVEAEDSYDDLPDPDASFDKNLENVIEVGKRRSLNLKNILSTNARKHVRSLGESQSPVLLEEALQEFYRGMRLKEERQFLSALKRVVDRADLIVNRPQNSGWSGFYREFMRLTADGRDFDDFFLAGPNRLYEELNDTYKTDIKIVLEETDLTKQLKDYVKEVESNLRKFARVLEELDRIPSSELAANRSTYQGRYPQRATMENLAYIDIDGFDLMDRHRHSLEAWSNTAVQAFAARVGGVDACPECRTLMSDIRLAYEPLRQQFPVSTNDILTAESGAPGTANIKVALADSDQLDKLLANIEKLRQLTPIQEKYISRRGLESFVADALAWADTIKKMKSGELQISYKLLPSAELNSISRMFSFCDLNGYYRAKRLSFNSPTFRLIEVNKTPDLEGVSAVFRLFNDTEGNRAESIMRIQGKELELFGFILANTSANEAQDTFDRKIQFKPNTDQRALEGVFRFKFSQPVALPPNWDLIAQ